MNKFSLILPDQVVDYRRFYFSLKDDTSTRLLCRLVGIRVKNSEIFPVYQPTFSYEKYQGEHYYEVHFSRWKSFIIKINKTGINGKWLNIKDQGKDL